jgi:hypothetical protein
MNDFIKCFTGLQRNFGFCNISNGYTDPNTGKIKFNAGDYGWSGKAITEDDYRLHLHGKKSIGIQPCDDNGLACFGAIDIDPKVYKDLDIKKYLDIIQEKELPLIPIKSKSGGLHLYLFTKEFVKAKVIRDFLEQVLFLFKLPITTEIFPKQTKLGSDTNGNKVNGNFINLPYFNKSERVALDPSGKEMPLDLFLKVVEINKADIEKLENISNNLIRKELTGGAEEFKDGPPCLEILSKNKMTDGRDRFLYNYMVFAKKKYPDNWGKMVLKAGRNYFEFDQIWTDNYIEKKIKNWEKQEKGHTCHDDLLAPVCIKSECVKRKFGIISDKKINWPLMTNLIKVDFKPDPEYYFTVEREDGETKQVHAKNVHRIESQKELRALLMEQVHIVPPTIKGNDFYEILKNLFEKSKIEVLEPAEGTNPSDILKAHINRYINDPQAKKYNSFKSGRPLLDDEYAYFLYSAFYDDLKTYEWKESSAKTSLMIKALFPSKKPEDQAKFDHSKKFPGKDSDNKQYPPLKTLRIPLKYFESEEDVNEQHQFESEEDIV